MQRYRVNYRLLVSLVIAAVVAAPAAYGLWRFQVDRNASRLLAQADDAEKQGDHETAYDNLAQYVKLRKEETEAQFRLGAAAAALSKEDDLDVKVRSEAYFSLVGAVQTLGQMAQDDPELENNDEFRSKLNGLRRKLIDLHMQYQYMDRALQAIDELREAGVEDADLMGLRSQCLFVMQRPEAVDFALQVVGYDQKEKAFDAAKALGADQPKVYAMLAQYLFATRQEELAEQVINQLAIANPESRDAFFYQYDILWRLNKKEEARAALEKAYALDPKDANVLQAKGEVAIDDYQEAMKVAGLPENAENADELKKDAGKYLEEAGNYFSEGRKLYPDNIMFYSFVARIKSFSEKTDEAMAVLEEGLKRFDPHKFVNTAGMPIAMDLIGQKIDILFYHRDIDGVRKEIKALRGYENQRVQAMADYYEARVEIFNQNWLEAARRLNDVKFRLAPNTNLQAIASASQGACHGQLGQWDLALKAYRKAREWNDRLQIAIVGEEEALNKLGQNAEAGNTALQFDQIVLKELAKPASEQDWAKVESQIDEFVRKQAEVRGAPETWVISRSQLLRAQMYVTRATNVTDEALQKELFAKARKAVTDAYNLDKDDPNVQLAAPRVLMLEPGSGPAKALKLLDTILASNKAKGKEETKPFRLLRIEALYALRDEQLPNQLHAATEGMQDWAKDDQAEIWGAVGNRFEFIGQLQDAELCLKQAAKLAPQILPYRVALFELARKQASDEGMRAAQQGILEIVKDKSAPDYVLTEVKRLMVAAATGAITKEDLKQARRLIDEAIKQRNTWSELYVLSGQLYMVLENDPAKALASFDQALQTGPANLGALNLQVRLLAELGRYADARKMMDRIPKTAWGAILDRSAANVLMNVNEPASSFAEAKKLAGVYPNDASYQLWYADVASQAKEVKAAEAAYKKAIELNPTFPDYWSSLLNFYMVQNRGPEVESTLRQAQLALDEEFLTLLTAQQHRLFTRFPQAESILLSSYSDRFDDPAIAQRMAEFYLNWSELDAAYRGKASRFLNTILRAANEGKIKQTDPFAAWARRQAARILSLNADYQDSLKAETLLAAALDNNASTPESTQLLIDILNRRGDPASRQRMIALMRKLQSERPLQPQYELQLGKAMFEVGDWTACERQMQDAIARYPVDLALRVGYIEMLILRKDAVGAERWISRLSNVQNGPAAMPMLRVRVAAAKGDKEEVRRQLVAMTPNLQGSLTEQQMKVVHAVAILADNVHDSEYALKLIVEYASRLKPPTMENKFELAQFTAMYGDMEQGFLMLNEIFPDYTDPVLSAAIEVLRARRSEDPAKLDAIIDRMVRRARTEDPDSARRMVQEAEALEIQQRYPQAIEAYTRLLDRDDVPKFVRATAYNNRSFLLAMTKENLDLALEGVNEAMNILGPISDILDTRGLVYIQRGQFDQAVEDLKLAVTMNSTANKYFHLAEAQLRIGDDKAALEAWKQAVAMGITLEKVPTVEQEDFKETVKKLEALGAAAPAA